MTYFKRQKPLIENVKDIMGTKDLLKWVMETNPTTSNKFIWEGISNSVWYAYHTEPMCITKSELEQLIERAAKFEIQLPKNVMKVILQLNEQLAANDIDIETIINLQKQLDHETQ